MSRRGRPPHPDILTPRQQEVLDLLRQGLTNTGIATELGISPDGVKFHVSEILGRLGVRRREEAARWDRDEAPAAPEASLRSWRVRRPAARRRCLAFARRAA